MENFFHVAFGQFRNTRSNKFLFSLFKVSRNVLLNIVSYCSMYSSKFLVKVLTKIRCKIRQAFLGRYIYHKQFFMAIMIDGDLGMAYGQYNPLVLIFVFKFRTLFKRCNSISLVSFTQVAFVVYFNFCSPILSDYRWVIITDQQTEWWVAYV